VAYSKATLIHRIRREIGDRPFYDICTEAMDTTETGLDVADSTVYDVGDVIEFQDDGEKVLVQALPSATSLTVARAYQGLTPGTGTSHSINATITKEPLVEYHQIEYAIKAVLQSMWPAVYHPLEVDITPVANTKYYHASSLTGCMEVLSAVQMHTDNVTPKFYNGARGSYPATLLHNMPAATYSTTKVLYIPYQFNTTNHIFVLCARLIDDTFSTPNYTYLNDGLLVEAVIDLTAATLVENLDIPRSTDQDNQMADQTVPAGTRMQVGGALRMRGQTKKEQYVLELKARAPRAATWYGVR
jgi:hypothetical protein